MRLIDLHADTITALYYNKEHNVDNSEFINDKVVGTLLNNTCQIDIDKLKQANSLAQFFVLWLNLKSCEKYGVSAWEHFTKLYNALIAEVDALHSEIAIAHNLSTLEQNDLVNKISAFIAVEEGAFITDLAKLDLVQSMNIRYITLVWNYETHIGVPSCIDQTRGLTKFGLAMVERMQELGILVDVSHLSDRGTYDVLSIAKQPIIASHSNARALCSHTRNLPDDLIRKIALNGGIIGVGCVPNFLDDVNKTISIDTMVRHIRHIYNQAGIDVIALGNDFDGYKCYTPYEDEIKSIKDVPLLIDKLAKAGFSQSQIEQIFYKNAGRILRDI